MLISYTGLYIEGIFPVNNMLMIIQRFSTYQQKTGDFAVIHISCTNLSKALSTQNRGYFTQKKSPQYITTGI